MHGVDLVVHAAAMKQVPICEFNPAEAVKTNIMGAQNVIDCAIDAGVARTVALSSDKAVNPVNLYGATKLCAEKLFTHGNVYAGSRTTAFASVRYGNVMGSRGSVIPLFRDQAKSGVLTVTDERMTRFWLSLDQAVDFVLFAADEMRGGEIFVPKIPSMRVTDLAKAIAPGALIKEIGIRPGEKSHETLLTAEEARSAREFDTHFIIGRPGQDIGGKFVPDDFVYASDNNTQWLSVERLAELASEHG
jgi:UDP-N-acetylglucosamine 4,6-dehydratase